MPAIKYITLEEELKKDPELKISDITLLKEWCNKLPHLPKIQDVEIAMFLQSNYFHIEPAKSTIENYYTYRTHMPEVFSNRDLHKRQQLRDTFKDIGIILLESKTKEGYSMVALHIINTDPSRFYTNELITSLSMIYDQVLWTQGSASGYVIVIDAIGATIGHVGRLNIITIKKFLSYIQEAMPIRLKGIYIINMSPIVEMVWNLIKSFIGEELIKLIQFHSTVQDISEYVPIEKLPNELGGKAGVMKELVDAQLKKIENFREWYFQDEKNNRVNESLRIGKSKALSDLCSMDGSFKKLEID